MGVGRSGAGSKGDVNRGTAQPNRRRIGLRTSVMCVLLATGLGLAERAAAQDVPAHHPACDAEPFHAFDFWEGEWMVDSSLRLADGSWRETTQSWTAEKHAGGCVLIDWAEGEFGPVRMAGLGTRYYVPAADHWVITWTSTQTPGQVGRWTGNFEDGVGDFLSEGGGTTQTRIRWFDVEENSASWEYAISQDGGENWTLQWTMKFRRTPPDGMDR